MWGISWEAQRLSSFQCRLLHCVNSASVTGTCIELQRNLFVSLHDVQAAGWSSIWYLVVESVEFYFHVSVRPNVYFVIRTILPLPFMWKWNEGRQFGSKGNEWAHFFALFFDTKDGDDMFLRNHGDPTELHGSTIQETAVMMWSCQSWINQVDSKGLWRWCITLRSIVPYYSCFYRWTYKIPRPICP
jgi:hypothetical protein